MMFPMIYVLSFVFKETFSDDFYAFYWAIYLQVNTASGNISKPPFQIQVSNY